MNGKSEIHPYWRALAGAGFGLSLALIWLRFGFWAAVFALVMIVVGGIVGVLAVSGE